MNAETKWTLIQGAAVGEPKARETFARTYLPVVRAYLCARWESLPLNGEIDDAVQEVFMDCFREGGALARLDRERCSGFRAYLFGIVRNVALRCETRWARDRQRREEKAIAPHLLPADETTLSKVFDREWARAIMREAADLMTVQARRKDPDALRRVELLNLRFKEGLPIREIAQRWSADPSHLHHEYARARKEFHEALCEVVSRQGGCPPDRIEEECYNLLGFLG